MTEYQNSYEGGLIYLPECLTTKTRIKNVLFKNCDIIGPAIVVVEGSCLFEGGFNLRIAKEVKVESAIWPAHDELLVGVIGLSDCKFVNCTWEGIGFVSSDEDDQRLLIEKATIARFEREFDE